MADERSHAAWDITQQVVLNKDRLDKISRSESSGIQGEEAFFNGVRVISRDTPINNGIYLRRSSENEAVLIDDQKDALLKGSFDMIERELLAELAAKPPESDQEKEEAILNKIFVTVARFIPSDPTTAQKRIDTEPGQDKVMRLSKFFLAGFPHHQALYAGYLLEKCIEKGHLQGKVSIDRNRMVNGGSNVWVRYIDGDNNVHVLDVAKEFKGKLDPAKQKEYPWSYFRPEDLNQK